MKMNRPPMRQGGPIGLTAILSLTALTPMLGWSAQSAKAQPANAQSSSLIITVNSNQDGPITADSQLTLREAIALSNGTLKFEQLSATEQQQVAKGAPRIQFQLPTGQTRIELKSALPDLSAPVTLDGTSQPGYSPKSVIFRMSIAAPIVEITPAPGVTILRGLTVTADNITIQGLSLYGFTGEHGLTASTPPADIFISHTAPPPAATQTSVTAIDAPFTETPPQNITIAQNWLGVKPDQSTPEITSAFGLSIFNGRNVTVTNNWIGHHDGSAIITAVRAETTKVTGNLLVGNGIAGMPDAIRLEGKISGSKITGNTVCGNDGSGVYLFKPEGAVEISQNRIVYNGRRLRRSAIYLMGNDHRVMGNTIAHQTAAGVVVAAYPESYRNLIQDNRFSDLEGLSIDLNAQNDTDVSDFQRGDGLNPRRNSGNRRKDTGNAAINAPKFDALAFPLSNNQVSISGIADRGVTQVQLYRVRNANDAGPLSEPFFTVTDIKNGRFAITVDRSFSDGDRISAIATDPNYGTSEPAVNAVIGAATTTTPITAEPPTCIQPPDPPKPPPPPAPPIVLKVPKLIHFALDKSNISPNSARILDDVATVLKANLSIIIDIEGHTDPRASDAYNLALGQRRALSARNYLLKQGVDPARMTLRSFGERQLISPGQTKVDFARDRRVEIQYKDINNIEVIVQETDLQIEP